MNEKKIKVLVLTSSFPRTKDDWWAQFILNIYKFMDKSRYEITILAPHAPESKRHEEINDIKIVRFPYFYPYSLQKLTTGSGILHSSRKNLFARFQILPFVLSELIFTVYLMTRYKYDLIHVHWVLPQGIVAFVCKFFYKIPFVVTTLGSDIFGLKSYDIFKKFVLKNCAVCTVISSTTYKKVFSIYSKTNIKLIPMGVDSVMFYPNKRKKFKSVKNPVILAVGRLIKCKGFEYLIKAMPKIMNSFPKSKLIIVGAGPEEKRLKKIVEDIKLSLGSDVIFTGALNHRKLSEIYRASTVCAIPSITDSDTGEQEAQGLVVLEALASGIPVVASRSGGIVDVVDGYSNGLLTKEKDIEDITEKVIILLKDKKLRDAFSKKGVKLVKEKYSWEKIAKEFEVLYKELVGRNKRKLSKVFDKLPQSSW